jgi:bifunctional DNA-binding transcriptional regulator/antitoxin component of YhaV-PrlF toxin-antitoxin module
MAESEITESYQTTVPEEVRQGLGLRPGDVLKWEVAGNYVLVSVAKLDFLEYRGYFKVGAGDPVEDVRRVRSTENNEDRPNGPGEPSPGLRPKADALGGKKPTGNPAACRAARACARRLTAARGSRDLSGRNT